MEARLLLPLMGLLVALPALAATLLASRRPGGPRPFLALVFLEVCLYFLGELVAATGWSPTMALVLNFGSALYSMPALYFFTRETLGKGALRTWPHFLPSLANLVGGTAVALAVAHNGFKGGWGTAVYLVAMEIGQTIQFLIYGRLGLALVPRGKGGEWTRRTLLAVLGGYGIFLVLAWLGLGLTALAELGGRPPGGREGLGLGGLLAVVLLAWTMGLCLLWGREARRSAGPKMAPSEATAILESVRLLLGAEEDLGGPDAEPQALAERLGLPYYVLSRAVNEAGSLSVGELVNEYRVARAKDLLVARSRATILEVALESGFQAKSTFNEVFRRHTGLSPGAFRTASRGARNVGPPEANGA